MKTQEITLNINGEAVTLQVEPEMPLLWVLRDELNMTGTKLGCGVAACGGPGKGEGALRCGATARKSRFEGQPEERNWSGDFRTLEGTAETLET